MAMGYNSCTFIGNLGQDPEIRHTQSGAAVASFSIGINSSWTDKNTGQKKDHTEWVNLTAFNRLAEIVGEYCKKGSKVFVTGNMRTEKYQDKNTGEDRYSTKVVVRELRLLDGRQDNQGQSNQRSQQSTSAKATADFDDDIPF